MDKFLTLSYNKIMKKFLLIILTGIILTSPVIAEETAESEQAKLLYADNNIEGSFNALLAIPEDKRTAENWLLLGNLLQDKGRNDDAIFMYTQAILKDEKFYKAHYNLANCYLNDDKPNMAIEEYKKVLKLRPEYAYAHYNLGCAYLKLGKYRKAKNAFLDAAYFKNTEPDFYYNLAYTYKKLEKPKDAQAYIEIYNKLMENKIE